MMAQQAQAHERKDDGIIGTVLITGLGMVGIIIFGMLFAYVVSNSGEEETAAAPPAPAPVVEEVAPPEPVIPEGAGVTASERDGKPLLTTYFESGKTEVAPEFATVAADLLAYLEANPDATVTISGFNDPTGDAELNAELSKQRAQNVQAALVAQGIDEARTDLVKPEDTTLEDLSNAEARRVEIAIVE